MEGHSSAHVFLVGVSQGSSRQTVMPYISRSSWPEEGASTTRFFRDMYCIFISCHVDNWTHIFM
jgi:hypothetical protein